MGKLLFARPLPWLSALVALGLVELSAASTYTLGQLVAMGLKNDETVRSVQEELHKTESQIWEQKGGAMPSLSAAANWQYSWDKVNPLGGGGATTLPSVQRMLKDNAIDSSQEPGSYLVAEALDGMMSGFSSLGQTPNHTLALTLELKQALYAQGKVSIGLDIAREYKQTLQQKYEAARQQASADISRLFYQGLLAEQNHKIRQEAIVVAQQSHALAVSRLALGEGSQLDTLGSRLMVERARIDAASALADLKTVADALIKRCGIEHGVESLELQGTFPTPSADLTLDEALVKMRQNNKVLAQLKGTSLVKLLLVKLQRADFKPLVYGGASIGKVFMYDKWDDWTNERVGWDDAGATDKKVFVGAQWTLFEGGKRVQRVRQATADVRMFELQIQQTEKQLELGVRSAYAAMQTAREQLASAQMMVTLAGRGFQLSQLAYQTGGLSQLDLEQKQLDVQDAHMAQNAAQFAYHSALLDLELLMGSVVLPE
jgi:outer membrane protein TolC